MSQSIFLFVGAEGFQVVDNNLHMPQSPDAEVPNCIEPDFGLDGKGRQSIANQNLSVKRN